ncbi:DNA repair protein RecO [Chitiniphilus shinanonensis]|uniref:DNA repair protein RecO n=1 Tax=Chitiniphilus shinanonensis TaxID=553088 RepID=A0ABQ6BMX1_9NEIS|nr:DNA repair protein RecO [Chitiniphilus shinanonensis]GLS03263.1 DNA repair protein RecO [Chitiniphilus shinanonensis]
MAVAKKPRRKALADTPRVDAQPALVLHQQPYRETSRLLDVFSRDHGRVAIVARGAQRPGSQARAVLLGFQPLLLSWFGAGELKTLHAAEWQGGIAQLAGLPLLCGFYLNELLQRLLPRDAPNPPLFAAYFEAIQALSLLPREPGAEVEPILRRFELALLSSLGYAPDWRITAEGQAVQPRQRYGFEPGSGLTPSGTRAGCPGEALLALAAGSLEPQWLLQVKPLMRQMIASLIGANPLHTRQLLIDLQRL